MPFFLPPLLPHSQPEQVVYKISEMPEQAVQMLLQQLLDFWPHQFAPTPQPSSSSPSLQADSSDWSGT